MMDRSFFQLSFSAIAITTTKAAVLRGFHFPSHLLLVHVTAALLREVCFSLYHRSCTGQNDPRDHHGGNLKSDEGFLPRLMACLGAVCFCGAMLCEYQAVQHLTTLPALTMLLATPPGSSVSMTSNTQLKSSGSLLTTSGMALILIFERSITGKALQLVLASTILATTAHAFKRCSQVTERQSDTNHFRTLLLALLCALAAVWHYEKPIYVATTFYSYGPFLVGSMISSSLRKSLSMFRETENSEQFSSCRYWQLTMPVLLLGLITIGEEVMGTKSFMSYWQYVGFAMILLADYMQLNDADRSSNHECSALPSTCRTVDKEIHETPRRGPHKAIMLCAALISFAIAMYLTVQPTSLAPPTNITASATAADSTFDIVISRYQEPLDPMAKQINNILSIPSIKLQTKRVWIYDTGNDHQDDIALHLISALPNTTKTIVNKRQNAGRESAAYLQHIIANYDTLADHTLFMQAQLHHPWLVQQKLASYLLPNTAFLHLTDKQEYCADCTACWDHSTWSESLEVLEEVLDGPCHGFSLTYRGQFVASRRRIRARRKEYYESLLYDLTDLGSEMHDRVYVEKPWMPGKVDSVNSPRFGYTVERMWGAIMSCADERLVRECPTMTSGWIQSMVGIKPDKVGECQCLDDPAIN